MKKYSSNRCLSVILTSTVLALSPVSSLLAQEEAGPIMTVYEVQVKHGHESKWREGVKAWNKCYADNGGKASWNAWSRMQGKGNVFAFSVMSDNWADLGERDPASRACREVFETQLTPHEDGEVTMMAQLMPGLSGEFSPSTNVVTVYNFKVDDYRAFTKVITDVTKAMQKADNTNTAQWYQVIGGGEDSPDYFIVVDHADFASLDKDSTGPWEAVEQQHGKETAEKWRASFDDSTSGSWNYMYAHEADLDYAPAAE
jgi:hypothetical protein